MRLDRCSVRSQFLHFRVCHGGAGQKTAARRGNLLGSGGGTKVARRGLEMQLLLTYFSRSGRCTSDLQCDFGSCSGSSDAPGVCV